MTTRFTRGGRSEPTGDDVLREFGKCLAAGLTLERVAAATDSLHRARMCPQLFLWLCTSLGVSLLKAQLRLQLLQEAQEFHLCRGAGAPNTNSGNVTGRRLQVWRRQPGHRWSAGVLVGLSGRARGRGGAASGPALAQSLQLHAAGVEPGAQQDHGGRPEGISEKDQEGSPDVRGSCRHVFPSVAESRNEATRLTP